MGQSDDIVFSGMGVVSPIGIGVGDYWNSLISKTSGVRLREDIGSLNSPLSIAGNIQGFDPKHFIKPRKSLKLMCRQIQLGFAATAMAVENANLDEIDIERDRIATIFGTESFYSSPEDFRSAFEKIVEGNVIHLEKWGEHFRKEIEPLWMLNYLPNMVASHVSIGFDARGPSNSIIQSDVSSLLAIIESAHLIERDCADIAIAGGTGCLSELTGAAYRGAGHLSKHTSQPAAACRPFDSQRDGTVLGEGAATFVLEKRSSARKRNQEIIAVLLGSARGFANPENPGLFEDAIARVLDTAIKRSDLTNAEIGHLNANGAGYPLLDKLEACAIKRVLGNVDVIAPKGHFGSLGGGTAAVELVATLASFKNSTLPPTMNCDGKDTLCPINVNVEPKYQHSMQPAVALNITAQGQIVAIVVAPCH